MPSNYARPGTWTVSSFFYFLCFGVSLLFVCVFFWESQSYSQTHCMSFFFNNIPSSWWKVLLIWFPLQGIYLQVFNDKEKNADWIQVPHTTSRRTSCVSDGQRRTRSLQLDQHVKTYHRPDIFQTFSKVPNWDVKKLPPMHALSSKCWPGEYLGHEDAPARVQVEP